ncbi:hypothetical protein ACPXCB_29575 [Micromonospora sp. DT62]
MDQRMRPPPDFPTGVRERWEPLPRLITVEWQGVEILFPDVIAPELSRRGMAMGHLADDNIVDVERQTGADPADDGLIAFRWTMRIRIAE